MASMKLKRQIGATFKMQGLQLTGPAINEIAAVVSNDEDISRVLGSILEALKNKIERKEIQTIIIDVDEVSSVIADLCQATEDFERNIFSVIGAFECAKICYDPARKVLNLESVKNNSSVLYGGPAAKAKMLRERLLLAMQRVARNEIFRPPVTSSNKKEYLKISSLDNLLGTHGKKCVLGILTQPKQAKYYIEDLTCHVPINFDKADYSEGLFTENCIVIVHGEMHDGVFHVYNMEFPPIESRAETMKLLNVSDPFGTDLSPQQMSYMKNMEIKSEECTLVILSDVNLNRVAVLDKLRVIFEGFSGSNLEPIFIFMGNFSSMPMNYSRESTEQVKDNFDALGNLISEFPNLAEKSKFVFIPGPNDPSVIGGLTLPRGHLPKYFTDTLRKNVKNIHFATSPCRLRVFTQDIVLIRDDLLKTMQRHCLVQPKESEMNMSEQLVKTLLDQGHLSPIALSIRPIHCEFDSALSLYPLPHVLVLADYANQYKLHYKNETWAVNPGSFPTDYSFILYRPATGDIEFSSC